MIRVVALVTSIAALLAAAFVAWSDERSRPVVVAQRVIAAIAARHAGATGSVVAPGWVRINLPTGTLVDLALTSAFAQCARMWSDCRSTIGALADDVDAVQIAIRSPRLADVQPVVGAEAASSARFGYVTRPLVGSLEVRYAVARGAALTFITSAGANAMQATQAQFAAAALARLRARPAPRTVSEGDGVFRVDDADDVASNLLDPTRMQVVNDQVGASPLACGIPSRGRLWVSGPAASAALAARLAAGKHETPNDPARAGVFPCDVANGG